MLKLTYTLPNDEFQTVTVLGDAHGIFDLWFRMTNAQYEYPSHGFGRIEVRNLDGHLIDMSKGLNEAICSATRLSRIERL